jgi:hypothetical protein
MTNEETPNRISHKETPPVARSSRGTLLTVSATLACFVAATAMWVWSEGNVIMTAFSAVFGIISVLVIAESDFSVRITYVSSILGLAWGASDLIGKAPDFTAFGVKVTLGVVIGMLLGIPTEWVSRKAQSEEKCPNATGCQAKPREEG